MSKKDNQEILECISQCNSTNSQEVSETKNSIQSSNGLKRISGPFCVIKQTQNKKKTFLIKKFFRYEEFMNEFEPEENFLNQNGKELKKRKNLKRLRFNKLAKTQLSDDEKLEKMKLLSKIARIYRRKLKDKQKKFRKTIESNFYKYINSKRIGNKKDKRNEIKLTISTLIKALKKLKHNSNPEYNDERYLLEKLVNLINSKKINFESIQFKILTSQVRMFLNQEQIKHLPKTKSKKIVVNFPGKHVFITSTEEKFYRKYLGDSNVAHAIFGINKNESRYKDLDISTQENCMISNQSQTDVEEAIIQREIPYFGIKLNF